MVTLESKAQLFVICLNFAIIYDIKWGLRDFLKSTKKRVKILISV